MSMEKTLNYSEVFKFMQEFQVDFLNRYQEMIIDEPTNTYVSIRDCKDMEDVKTFVVFALCRPIAKGLDRRKANMLLKRINKYFEMDLTREDMHLMYGELCYLEKFEQFKDFIKRGFPMHELPLERK